MKFRVVPIPNEIAKEVRETLKSPQYGHPAHVDTARGYGPCRSCLRTFRKGEEERILFTYNSFAKRLSVPTPGPIFIHKEECEPFDDALFPTELRGLPLLFEAYETGGAILMRELTAEERIEDTINHFFKNETVEFINVRNREAGCFIAQIERAE